MRMRPRTPWNTVSMLVFAAPLFMSGQIQVARHYVSPGDPAAIGGRVVTAGGIPVPSVFVSLTGNPGGQTLTGTDGSFSFTGLSIGGSYTVTPSYLQGNSFYPSRMVFGSLESSVAFTFTLSTCVTGAFAPNSVGATVVVGPAGFTTTTFPVTVQAPGCSWTMTLPNSWIQGPGGTNTVAGTGNQQVNLTIDPNDTGTQRKSVISIGGFQFTISQQPYIRVFGTGTAATPPNLSFVQDGLLDPHYTITSEPAGISKPNVTNSYVVNSSYYPSTAWFPNNQAKWITPELPVANTGLQGVPPGTYTYQTTLDLTGFILSTVTLTGRWGADDTGTMSVNGLVNTASPAGGSGAPCAYGFQCANPFTLTQANGLVAGLNTLTFVVTNLLTFNNASGLYVEISGSGTQGPDFSVSANPPTKTAPAGTQVQYPISITNLNGYTGAPVITVAAPANVTASFSNNTIFASSSTPGTYAIPVTATDSAAGLTHIFNLTYTASSIGLAPFTIFSTGLSDPDPNYWIAQSPDWRFAVQPRQVLASNPVNTPLFTTWRANTASSDWIAPRPDEGLGNNGSSSTANYRYRTKFYLFQQDPTHSTITGNFVADASAKIWINGYQQAPIASSPANATNFNLTNNLTWGENTLDFEVVNTNTGPDRPTGVNAVLSGQGNSVATPGFQVIPSPIIQSVTAGSTATYSLQSTQFNGLNTTTSFAATAPPSSAGITVTPTSGTLGAQLTLSAATTYLTVPGAYEIPFNATPSGTNISYNVKPVLLVQPQPPTLGPINISGATSSGTLTFVMTPGSGYANYTQFLINTTLSGTNDCQVLHENDGSGGHLLFLSPPDWGTSGWQGPLRPGQAGTLTNGRCTLDVGASSASVNTNAANQTTYNLKFSFAASWAGAKNVYFNPSNSYFQAIPWTQVGIWTVPGTAGSPAFSLSASSPTPTSVVAGTGGTVTSTVTITGMNGFNSAVNLAPSGWPSGISVGAFGTNPTSTTSSVSIIVSAAVVPGVYSLTLNGSSGTLSATTTLGLTVTATPGACGGSGYLNCRSITVTSQAGTTSLMDFPMAIKETFAWMATTANGGEVTHLTTPAGSSVTVPADLIFTQDAGCTQMLSWEFESYSAPTGAFMVWVKVPALLANAVIYACDGNTNISTFQSSANGTWNANYKSVYHMNDAVTTGGQTLVDRTTRANHLTTAVQSTSSFASVTGKLNKAVRFIPANQYLGASALSGSDSGTGSGPLTLEMWVNAVNLISQDGGSQGQDIGVLNTVTTSQSGAFVAIASATAGHTDTIEGVVRDNLWHQNPVGGQAIAAPNTWYHVALAYDNAKTTMYVNGSPIGTFIGAWTRDDGPVNIGQYALGWGYRFADFAIEEFRVSATAWPAAWVQAGYNNQNAPSSFYTFGSSQTGGGTTGDYTLSTIRGYDSVGLPPTGSANHTLVVRVTSVSGFAGTVSLTPVIDTAGAQAQIVCPPASVSVAANQFANATVTCAVPSSLVPQRGYINGDWTYPSYNVTAVNATNGTIAHSLTGAANLPLVLTPLPWTLPTTPTAQIPASVAVGSAQQFTMVSTVMVTTADATRTNPTVSSDLYLRFQDQALGPYVAAGSCTVHSSTYSGAVWLNNNDGSYQAQTYPINWGTNESNSQCAADFQHGTGVFSYANQTWTSMTPLTFTSTWSGRTVHAYVRSTNEDLNNSGWRDLGPVVIQ